MTQIEKEDIDKWANEAMKILKDYGYLSRLKLIHIIVVGLLGLMFLLFGYYAGTHDFFKSDVNQTVSLEPITTINNSYLFTPFTENEYKFTMPNQTIIVNIPENLCD